MSPAEKSARDDGLGRDRIPLGSRQFNGHRPNGSIPDGSRIQVQSFDPALLNGVDERTWLLARRCNRIQVVQMALHHLCGSQILACDAEASDTEGLNCFALHRSTSNACILHELSPALGACQLQPVDIGHIFVRRNSVVLCERDETQTGVSQQPRNLDPPKASIKEEVRQPVGTRHAGRPQDRQSGRRSLPRGRAATRPLGSDRSHR